MKLLLDNTDALPEAARRFLDAAGSRRIFSFDAPMGAGKTTFITAVCRELGVGDDVGSPTFSIINEYASEDGSPVYHFDFYRLDSPSEALDMGVEDYFYSGNYCFIEWPDRIDALLPEESVEVKIEVLPDGRRMLSMDD